MKKIIFLLTAIIALAQTPLRAAESTDTPPTAPFVRPPPEQSAWKIKVTRSSDDEKTQSEKGGDKSRVVVGIESTRFGETKRDVVTYSNDSKEEIWYVGRNVLTPYPDGTRVGIRAIEEGGIPVEPVSELGFPGLDWPSNDTYEGTVKKGGQQCRHYVKKGEGDRWEAWIGMESGLPVAAQFGNVIHTYTFTTAPTAPIPMPAMYVQALESVNKQSTRAGTLAESMPPTPPFVRPPPDHSAWTIKVTRPPVGDDAQKVNPEPKHKDVLAIVSAHYGDSKRDVVYYSDNSKVEIWYVGDAELVPYPNGSRIGVLAAGHEGVAIEPVSARGFPGLDWPSVDSYKDVAKIADQKCRHYVKVGDGDPWEAWIGMDSGLPVAARYGNVVHTYNFTESPSAPLQMPPAYAQALDAVKKQAARAAALSKKFRHVP